ncbi:MAG TPA: DHA2 family efflux MFS transporter permease subunit [Conexibacter sp.]|nr:DHA2 family efflux MFS transporter permease subunit [Conexibacter sp.]
MARVRKERVRENPTQEFLYANRNKIFGVMMIGWFMSLMDVSIVNITIPELEHDFETSLTTVSWVANAYNIAFAVLLITAGRLADQFGRKKFFIAGLTIFTVGSALCATSWDIGWLIGFRALQGVGAGLMAPLGFAITALVFPPAMRGRGLALIAVIALAASGLGPVLGGVLVQYASWEWIFIINVPIGTVGVFLALRWWPETYDLTSSRRVDWLGMVLLTASVGLFIYGLVEANVRGWGDASVLFFLQISIVLGIGFVLWQRRFGSAMIPQALQRNKQFLSANMAMFLLGAGALGSLFLLALVFVNLWGYSQLDAALALTPIGACGMIMWPIVGKGADHLAPYRLAMPALLSMTLGLLWFSFLPSTYESQLDYLVVLPGIILFGLGVGTAFPAINVGGMGAAVGPEVGVASGIINTSRQIGAAFGIAVLIAVLTTTSGWYVGSRTDPIEDRAYVWAIPNPIAMGIVGKNLAEFGGVIDRTEQAPAGGFDRWARRQAAGIARDGFGWAFRGAALLLLLALPFARRLTRTPEEVRQAAMAAMAAAQAAAKAAAGGGGAAAPVPAGAAAAAGAGDLPPPDEPAGGVSAPARVSVETRIAELEDALRSLRAQVGRTGAEPDGNGDRKPL